MLHVLVDHGQQIWFLSITCRARNTLHVFMYMSYTITTIVLQNTQKKFISLNIAVT